jgi:hypothetical protein
VSITWALTVFDPDAASTYNFTDRLQGFDVKQMAHPARLGTGEAIFRLRNFDGALTPNGSGTYAGVDWGSSVFKLAMNTSTDYHEVFEGFAADFIVTDDGVTSFIDFVCDDPYAIVGRGLNETAFVTASGSGFRPIPETIQNLINLGALFKSVNGIKLPKLNQTSAEAEVIDVSLMEPTVNYARHNAEGRVGERIANGMLPATAGVIWPGTYRTSGGVVYWRSYCVGEGLSADTTDATRIEHTLTETLTGAAAEAVLDTLQTGHNLGEITNSVNITVQAGIEVLGAKYESRNDSSAEKYGERGANWPNHMQARTRGTTGGLPNPIPIDLEPYAQALTNRFSEYRYTARTASTKQSQNTTANAEAEFGYLCDIRYGIWAPCSVKYTPTGAAAQVTDVTVITRRRLRGTPSDVTVELELLPAIDYQSLVLNSDMLGTLDYNRLG